MSLVASFGRFCEGKGDKSWHSCCSSTLPTTFEHCRPTNTFQFPNFPHKVRKSCNKSVDTLTTARELRSNLWKKELMVFMHEKPLKKLGHSIICHEHNGLFAREPRSSWKVWGLCKNLECCRELNRRKKQVGGRSNGTTGHLYRRCGWIHCKFNNSYRLSSRRAHHEVFIQLQRDIVTNLHRLSTIKLSNSWKYIAYQLSNYALCSA